MAKNLDDFGYFVNMISTKDDGYLLLGAKMDSDTVYQNAWISKIDHNGNVQWKKMYASVYNDYVIGACELEDSSYLVLGNKNVGDIWYFKIDKYGEILWQKTYGGTGIEYPSQIIKLKNNTFYNSLN